MERLKVDHLTIAGSELPQLERVFADLNLRVVYGGAHSNGITHMSIIGFEDGSYLELISTLERGQQSPLWGDYISNGAGLCAWAVDVDDVARESARLSGMGIVVNGPRYMNRRRPDGNLAEWDLAYIGDGEPGAKLPFIIKDRTDRQIRISPTVSADESELLGAEKIILGTSDMDSSIELFRRVYTLPAPSLIDDADFGGRLANFAGTPVVLASPLGERGWLAERLKRFGDLPCGFLIKSRDFEKAKERFGFDKESAFFEGNVCWFDEPILNETRMGFVS